MLKRVMGYAAWRDAANPKHGATASADRGRLFLQVHYGRRDIAQRLRTTEQVNQLSDRAIARAKSEPARRLIGLHDRFFYDG